MNDMTKALRLIAVRSENMAHEAAKTLVATTSISNRQRRYNWIASHALSDPAAAWTPEERALIVGLMELDEDMETRSSDLRIRVTMAEKTQVQAMAEAEGVTVSEFVRSRIGLS